VNQPCLVCGRRKPAKQMAPVALGATGRRIGQVCRGCREAWERRPLALDLVPLHLQEAIRHLLAAEELARAVEKERGLDVAVGDAIRAARELLAEAARRVERPLEGTRR